MLHGATFDSLPHFPNYDPYALPALSLRSKTGLFSSRVTHLETELSAGVLSSSQWLLSKTDSRPSVGSHI